MSLQPARYYAEVATADHRAAAVRTAEACYRAAMLWAPQQGKPYNQLATVAAGRHDRAMAFYWFYRR